LLEEQKSMENNHGILRNPGTSYPFVAGHGKRGHMSKENSLPLVASCMRSWPGRSHSPNSLLSKLKNYMVERNFLMSLGYSGLMSSASAGMRSLKQQKTLRSHCTRLRIGWPIRQYWRDPA